MYHVVHFVLFVCSENVKYTFRECKTLRINAINNPIDAATITYALYGIILNPNVATNPDTIITSIFFIFLKSLTNIAIKVKGTAKLRPKHQNTRNHNINYNVWREFVSYVFSHTVQALGCAACTGTLMGRG